MADSGAARPRVRSDGMQAVMLRYGVNSFGALQVIVAQGDGSGGVHCECLRDGRAASHQLLADSIISDENMQAS